MSLSFVSVNAGRIRVQPSFADMLLVQRLGGRFSGVSRAWEWPATEANARKLKIKLHTIRTTDEFETLVAGAELIPASEPEIRSGTGTALLAGAAPAVEAAPDLVPTAPAEAGIAVPEGLLTQPWRHQLAAFKFCMDKFGAGFFGILLAMSMGTGKSLVFCMLMLALGAHRTLIACPLRVVPVWVTQFERHVGMPVVIVALDDSVGSVAEKQQLAAEKLKLAESLGRPFICIINFDSGWRPPFGEWAKRIHWHLVGADEAHKIKSPTGRASKYFGQQLARHADYCVALTGTPMAHNHTDIFGILRFVDVNILGQYWGPLQTRVLPDGRLSE